METIEPDNTKNFILQRVAPIFNKQGYAGTSLSDLTKATGLTKGAIYCNFKNKEDLAIKAFKLNVKRTILPLSIEINKYHTSIKKLYALTNYYREYYDLTAKSGGCPILNVGSDANNINPVLFNVVKEISKKLENELLVIIKNGLHNMELRPDTNAHTYAKNIYSMIEGSVFMAHIHQDKTYLVDMMNYIDNMIIKRIAI